MTSDDKIKMSTLHGLKEPRKCYGLSYRKKEPAARAGRKEEPMDEKEQILKAMRDAGVPLNAGKIAELTGLDRKVVDKAMDAMKKDGSIVSPVRCKWQPA